ncbi:helix-turn-helix-type transcriptional regulator [Pseudomonas sp. YY-1]|uniref:MerR family transcriptional regulator n=1 Tax=unclassified Pseudomonas TaxID=196821 RepID=UPI000CB905CB|nr:MULTISPECIES: MerR family transcriptional regulator [unclassified Pseudomonas]PKQ40604.1 helix-turn-helix-type transcriptional regulator [Pseudomonas sp. YY-1]RRV25928.1 MerR family transcriptional regulator [Pseudomonas sp. o96-267]
MPELASVTSLASSALKQEELFPIREVSRLTGVNPVTLRAWERRYGLIQPTRTDSGHRLYSQADIDAVRSILAWIERGVAVSKVGSILAKSASSRSVATPAYNDVVSDDWSQWQDQLRSALQNFDESRLERVYGQIFSCYPLQVVFQSIFMPVWQELLLRQDEVGQRGEWLMLDGFLRGRCWQRLQLGRDDSRERVLLVALPGHCRELELLVAALLLGNQDVDVAVMGPGVPMADLALVCERMQPQALVVFSNQPPGDEFPRQLARLALGLECPVLLAGDSADLAEESLAGSPIACLGNEGRLMQRRLQQFLAGHLDT